MSDEEMKTPTQRLRASWTGFSYGEEDADADEVEAEVRQRGCPLNGLGNALTLLAAILRG